MGLIKHQNSYFPDFIRIDRRKKDPIYLQITYQFINAIQRNIIEVNTKIPGTRTISKQLGIHRKTVIAAFNELEAQGWIKSVPNKGTYIQYPEKKPHKIELKEDVQKRNEKIYDIYTSHTLSTPYEKTNCTLRIDDGRPDFRLIDHQELVRFYAGALKRKSLVTQFDNIALRNNSFFIEQLSYYLNLTRGFHIAPNQICTSRNKELLITALVQRFIQSGETVLVGALSHFIPNMLFKQNNANLITIPIDGEGLVIAEMEKICMQRSVRFIIIDANSQYPTTVPFSQQRKEALYQLAEKYGCIVLEIDDDFDFYYEQSQPLPIGTSGLKNTLYIGKLGAFLPSDFQMSFMIGNPKIIALIEEHLQLLEPQMMLGLQQALGEMIKEGDFHRYKRKALKIYQERRDYGVELLRTTFKSVAHLHNPEAGLAFWLDFDTSFPMSDWVRLCKSENVFIPRICLYQNRHYTALRLGFGSKNKQEFTTIIRALNQSLKKTIK